MIAELGKDADGRYAYLLFPGGEVKIYLTNGAGTVTDNTIIGYRLSSGEIYNVYDTYLAEGEIDSINGNIIKTVDNSFVVDEDTLYYDNSGDNPISVRKTDLGRGIFIKIYSNDRDLAADAIEIIKAPVK